MIPGRTSANLTKSARRCGFDRFHAIWRPRGQRHAWITQKEVNGERHDSLHRAQVLQLDHTADGEIGKGKPEGKAFIAAYQITGVRAVDESGEGGCSLLCQSERDGIVLPWTKHVAALRSNDDT